MNISTEKPIIVYRYDGQYGTTYSIRISKKNEKGEYINAFIPIKLKDNADLKNNDRILINQAFLSFYSKKDNMNQFYIMILDYQLENEKPIETIKMDEIDYQEELPF